MQTVNEILNRTGILEPQTKVSQAPTPGVLSADAANWSHWFGFQTCGDDNLLSMVTEAALFARALLGRVETKPYWLTLCGSSGAGKTHLARGLYRVWQRHASWHVCPVTGAQLRDTGAWWNWSDLCDALKGGAWGLSSELADEPFLVIDDLGSAHDPSGACTAALYSILNRRERKWTVLTSNLCLPALAEIDQRIASRVIRGDNVCFEVETMDYALRGGAT